MNKLRLFIFTTLIFLFTFFIQTTTVHAAIGADCGNHGRCGGTSDGCGANEICIDATVWDTQGGKCEASNGRCENRDDSRNEVCGYTDGLLHGTDQWCGARGGCATGYLCNSTSKKCELNNGDTAGGAVGSACANIQEVYDSQCGYWTSNQCGAAGVCQTGYRCVAVTSIISRTGYACRPDPTDEPNKCPGSPTQPAVALSCGESSDNPNATCSCSGTGAGLVDLAYGKKCCGWKLNGGADCGATSPTTPLLCGQTSANSTATCGCTGATLTRNTNVDATTERNQMYCCGWINGKSCGSTKPATPVDPANPVDPTDPGTGGADDTTTLDIFAGPNSEDFKLLNPIANFSTDAAARASFTSPGGIISRVLLFAFPIAGLILFVMLVIAGFQIVAGAASSGSKSIDAGKQRASNALLGFVLLFVAYWVMQIIETIFGITIL
jgi:hypothetical protein